MSDREWLSKIEIEHPKLYEMFQSVRNKSPALFNEIMEEIRLINVEGIEYKDIKLLRKYKVKYKKRPVSHKQLELLS